MRREKKRRLSESAASGIVALIFLVLGFQIALFLEKIVRRPAPAEGCAQVQLPVALPDSVNAGSGLDEGPRPERSWGTAGRTPAVRRKEERKVESFRFDPNTVTVEDLMRLGLSQRQAESVDNYRRKGGRFRRPGDFARMYVVSDTHFSRLEPFIDIPSVELNSADSAALVSLRGIGPYFARMILSYRDRLGGFYSVDQLMEVERFDSGRLDEIRDQLSVDTSHLRRLDLRIADEATLASHPYVGARAAKSVLRFRKVYDSASWTLARLVEEKVFPADDSVRLSHYLRP